MGWSRSITTLLFALSLCSSAQPVLAGTPLTAELVVSGLERPVGAWSPPGDFNRIFVVEKLGSIRVVQNDVLQPGDFLNIDSIVGGGSPGGDERGLLGLAFHPDYMNNGFFYVYYTTVSNPGSSVLARYTALGDPATSNVADPGSAQIIMSQSQPEGNHNGGWIGFGPNDKFLYIALGDGGGANDSHGSFGNGQNLNTRLGKMLRIDIDGGFPFVIPPDNPFVGIAGLDEIWAYGLRNPWRNAFDRLTGDLYIADVGQNIWEEVNFQPAASAGGENYGWRCMEGNACFITPSGPNCTCGGANLSAPFHTYSHGGNPFRCSITGGEVYRGCRIKDLDGTYFFADWCSDTIWSIPVDPVNVLELQNRKSELDPGNQIRNVTSFGTNAYGDIYICDQGSASANGELWRIVPDAAPINDCNLNGVEDDCELADGSVTDDDLNGVPDVCQCLEAAPTPLAEQFGVDGCAVDGDCPNLARCINGICYSPKNRYICFEYNGLFAGRARVTHVGSGRQWWVGPVGAGDIALLGDTPATHNAVDLSVICVTGCGISPDQEYDLQVIAASCDVAEEDKFSEAIRLPTVVDWGDILGSTEDGVAQPPDGTVNLNDVFGIVRRFQGLTTAVPLSWADLVPQTPNIVANLADAFEAVLAFQGAAYTLSLPGDCPS